MRTAADAVVAEYLPAGKDIYLGYIDGKYQSYNPIKARFPHALVVPIATQAGGNVGTVFDGPPDNGTWPEVVAWVVRRRKAGVDPTVNTTGSAWATGVQAFNTAHVAQPHWWISSWNGDQSVPAGAIGHQFETVPGRYDLSVFLDYWPGVDPPPAGTGGGGTGGTGTHPTTPAPAPAPVPFNLRYPEDDMIMLDTPTGVWLLSGSLLTAVASPPDVTAFKNAGVPLISASAAQLTGLQQASAALTGKLAGTLAVSGSLTAS